MIKATIQNSPYCTEIVFPCTETELSKKLGEIKMNPEHLAPMAMVLEIEPCELSVLTDCDVNLDALNYLGKRLDGMDEGEHKQYLAVLSCPEISEGWGLKNMINLTDSLARYTLIEDTDDLERIGRTHMLNVRGVLSESEYNNSEWLAEEGMKLLESGKGIDTEYGKIFVNDEIPFEEHFNGTTFPPYLYNGAPVTVDISYIGLMEMVELPCEELAIKKAVCRIGADRVSDCQLEISTFTDLSDKLLDKVMAVEKTKNIFELNKLLNTIDFSAKQEQPMSIFQKEVARRLCEDGYNFTFENGEFAVTLNDGDVIKIRKDDVMYSNGEFSETGREAFYALYHLNREVDDMAVSPVVLKAIVTAATDKRTWKVVGIIIAVILLPFILLIMMIAGMVSGVESANNELLNYSFVGTAMPDNFTNEQCGVIEDMREWLGELDEIISEKEKDEECSLDGNMVRAAFYCLNFGGELDEEFDFESFCDCFDGLTIEQLETALQNVSEQFPQYEITENIEYSIPKVYKYLNGEAA